MIIKTQYCYLWPRLRPYKHPVAYDFLPRDSAYQFLQKLKLSRILQKYNITLILNSAAKRCKSRRVRKSENKFILTRFWAVWRKLKWIVDIERGYKWLFWLLFSFWSRLRYSFSKKSITRGRALRFMRLYSTLCTSLLVNMTYMTSVLEPLMDSFSRCRISTGAESCSLKV